MMKAIVPALIALLICSLTVIAALISTAHLSFRLLLSGTFEYNEWVLRKAEAELLFREAAIRPAPGQIEARQLGDMRFQLAEAYTRSPDIAIRERAAEHYAAAIALEPSLRHGWPHLRLGEMAEQANNRGEAAAHYRNAALYDSGGLSLLALFRAASIDANTDPAPADPRPVYAFLKYGSTNPEIDILSFRTTEWRSFPEALFLSAWQDYAAGRTANAVDLMRAHLRQRPNDPTASYSIGEWTGAHRVGMYPEGGGLLTHAYSPHAYLQPSLRLPHEARFRSVYYRVYENEESVRLRIRYRNLALAPVRIHLSHNLERKDIERPTREQDSFDVEFESVRGRNVVELYFYFPNVERIQPALRWVHLDQARILPVNGERTP